MEVLFSLIGVDVDGKIINVANCKEDLAAINEVLRYYEIVAIEGFYGSYYVSVDNPYDFADIASDLKM